MRWSGQIFWLLAYGSESSEHTFFPPSPLALACDWLLGSRIQLQQRDCSRISRDFSHRSTDQTRKELEPAVAAGSKRLKIYLPVTPDFTNAEHSTRHSGRSRCDLGDLPRRCCARGQLRVRPRDTARRGMGYWFHPRTFTFVAEQNGEILGTYILRRNQQGFGAHVANAAFMVSPAARRRGLGRLMAEHSLEEARRLGFRAMQFNFVVETNETAISLWRQLGFAIIGTTPGAFRHPERGLVDAHIMFRSLE